MSWFRAIYSMEFRRIFSYRVDFWISFLGSVAGEIAVAYFLWDAIYKKNQAAEIAGYSFTMMILYYVFAAFGGRIIRGNERMIVATDIYDGGLTKYLMYPISYVLVNFAQALAYNTLTLVQFALGIAAMFLLFGKPAELNLEVSNFIMGISTCLVASCFYFVLYVTIDYIAFWADTVWSLSVMYRFVAQFLSGIYVPIEMFPASFVKLVYFTPFPYIGAEPIKMFLGRSSWQQWVYVNTMIVLWIVPAMFALHIVWKRGLKTYTGVGI